MDVKTGVSKLMNLYIQIQSLDEEIKAIKDELKESGHNQSIIASVAKAMASNKGDDLVEKSETTLSIIEEARS